MEGKDVGRGVLGRMGRMEGENVVSGTPLVTFYCYRPHFPLNGEIVSDSPRPIPYESLSFGKAHCRDKFVEQVIESPLDSFVITTRRCFSRRANW